VYKKLYIKKKGTYCIKKKLMYILILYNVAAIITLMLG
jgi:hypothetical protein